MSGCCHGKTVFLPSRAKIRLFETIFVAECLPCFYDLKYQLDRPPERVPPLVELVFFSFCPSAVRIGHFDVLFLIFRPAASLLYQAETTVASRPRIPYMDRGSNGDAIRINLHSARKSFPLVVRGSESTGVKKTGAMRKSGNSEGSIRFKPAAPASQTSCAPSLPDALSR
jgi:hypothetical protein